MRRRVLLGLAAVASVAGLGGCQQGPRYRYRYKLTLNVSDHGVMRTSSNVVQVDTQFAIGPAASLGPGGSSVKGDANVTTLGDGRVLVALLTKRDPLLDGGRPIKDWQGEVTERLLARAYDIPDRPVTFDENRAGVQPRLEAIEKMRGARPIALSDLPTLVTFRDVRDPLTVETVDPQNLAASFGPGVTLESATIEVTDDQISRGIERALPWLPSLTDYLDGSRYENMQDNRLPAKLVTLDFKR